MSLETFFKGLDIKQDSSPKELTVFYDEAGNIQHVVPGLIKEECLGQRYKSYSGTILTNKPFELTSRRMEGYRINEYRHPSSGFLPADASGGGVPSNIKKLWTSCNNCCNLDTKKLVNSKDTVYKTPWKDVGKSIFGCKDTENCHFNAIDMAKAWIVGTDGTNNSNINTPNSKGGCASCQSAIAVALAEGGNQVPPSEVTPITDGLPRNMFDPTFTTAICKGDEKCTNGGPWQVSSAFIPGKGCPDCDKAGCSSLENPICAAKIAMEHNIGADQYSKVCPAGTKACNVNDMQKGIDPNCYFGPFGLCSAGWNSPSCSQLYRRGYSKEGYTTFGRIAINACSQAASELKSAGWSPSNGECNIDDPLVIQAMKGHTDGKGTWDIPPSTIPCMCAGEPCLQK